jgi:hypothetical protein
MTTKLGCKFIAATNTQRFEADPMATHGHLWPPLYSQVAHCYALVKTSTRGTAQGLPAAFPGRLRPQRRVDTRLRAAVNDNFCAFRRQGRGN